MSFRALSRNLGLFFFLAGLVLSLAIFVPSGALAATEVAGLYTTDQTWTLAGSPYVVVRDPMMHGVGVGGGATLTIEPGVVVKFQSAAQLLTGTGKIIANGAPEAPIIFTSFLDDFAGGDTNGDATSTTPFLGDWLRLSLGNDSDSFSYVQVRYGQKCININHASVAIRNSLVEKCGNGLDINAAGPNLVITGNTIRDNYTGLLFLSSEGAGFSNNNIYQNALQFGAENLTPLLQAQARDNWWGDPNGPCLPANHSDCTGFGDKITEGFIVESFLTEAVTDPFAPPPPATEPPLPGQVPQGGSSGQPPVPSPKILKFEAEPAVIKEGENARVVLRWESEGAEYARIEAVGPVGISSSLVVRPEQTTTYRLVIMGPRGEVSAETTVEVLARDPVVVIPGILGSMKNPFTGKWELDPILGVYHGLVDGLKAAGYEEGQTLFPFPYDWRRDNRETAADLGQKIDEILRICGCQKVDVVAHSMGGLVTRWYIQNIRSDTIDQIIFLGTPHLGAPKAYLAWEAGEMGPAPENLLLEKMLALEALVNGHSNVVKYIHEKIISIQQLLPIFEYLTSYKVIDLYEYGRCAEGLFTCNPFLEELRGQKLENGRAYNLINDGASTYRAFIIGDQNQGPEWIHGKPLDYPKPDGMVFGSGDGTVPVNSADEITDQIIKIQAEHKDLPYYSQSEIMKILLNKGVPLVGRPPGIKILLVSIKSPADITITDPTGKSFGAGVGAEGNVYYSGEEDPEFMTIADPAEGEYEIILTGTGEGKFELEAAILGDDLEISKTFAGEIIPNKQYKFMVSYEGQGESKLDLIQKDIEPPVSELMIRGEKLGEAYLEGAFAEISAQDHLSAVSKILYSLDLGQNWQEYTGKIDLSKPKTYEIYYRAFDGAGNEETAKFAVVKVIERPVPVKIENPPLSESISAPLPQEQSATSSEEVLGAFDQTEPEKEAVAEKNDYLLSILLSASVFTMFFIIIYLRKQKE